MDSVKEYNSSVKEYNRRIMEEVDPDLMKVKKIFGKKVLVRLFKAEEVGENGLIVPARSDVYVDDRTHRVKHKPTIFGEYTYRGVVVGIGEELKDDGVDIKFGDIVHISPSVNLQACARSLIKKHSTDVDFKNYFLINIAYIEWKEVD